MGSSTDCLGELDRVGYDPAIDTYHSEPRWENANSLSLLIVEAVSAITGREPTALEPLYSVVDPEALESLLSSAHESDMQVSFAFEGCTVGFTGGELVVEPQ